MHGTALAFLVNSLPGSKNAFENFQTVFLQEQTIIKLIPLQTKNKMVIWILYIFLISKSTLYTCQINEFQVYAGSYVFKVFFFFIFKLIFFRCIVSKCLCPCLHPDSTDWLKPSQSTQGLSWVSLSFTRQP